MDQILKTSTSEDGHPLNQAVQFGVMLILVLQSYFDKDILDFQLRLQLK